MGRHVTVLKQLEVILEAAEPSSGISSVQIFHLGKKQEELLQNQFISSNLNWDFDWELLMVSDLKGWSSNFIPF